MEPFDLRWLTAVCQILTGAVIIAVVMVTWFMEPPERAERLGPYVTPEGIRKIINNLPNALMFGVFITLSGISKWAFYERWHGGVADNTALAISTLEAVVGAGFAAVLIWKTVRAA